MLGDKNAAATLAVKDMAAAKNFYEGTLGLSRAKEGEDGGILYKTGNSTLFAYQSQYAGTNQATAVTFDVGDALDSIIKDLEAKGVKFEQYDGMPGVTREGNIHVFGNMKSAWFKDPDGNILNLNNQS